MDSNRIKELQKETGYPNSISVYKALMQVWNECQQEHNEQLREKRLEDESELYGELLLCDVCDKETKHDTALRGELYCLKCGNVVIRSDISIVTYKRANKLFKKRIV